jgi:hypothetical protein
MPEQNRWSKQQAQPSYPTPRPPQNGGPLPPSSAPPAAGFFGAVTVLAWILFIASILSSLIWAAVAFSDDQSTDNFRGLLLLGISLIVTAVTLATIVLCKIGSGLAKTGKLG